MAKRLVPEAQTPRQVVNRADQIKRKQKEFVSTNEASTTLLDVDGAIMWHMKNKIKPKVVDNGEVVDVKTASNYAFKKFADGSLHENDTFGYLMQLAAYEAAEESKQGAVLAVNKESGQLAYYSPFDVFKPDPNKKIENILQVLEEDTPPEICYQPVAEGKQGNMRLDKTCVYCSHKRECWRDANGGQGLRAFKYATGIKYFTRVSSLPKVDEIPLL